MAMHDLPVLTIVCANRKWTAVQGSALGMYPAGSAAAAGQLSPLAELGPAVAFEQYATASGGYGEAVTDRADLVPALQQGAARGPGRAPPGRGQRLLRRTSHYAGWRPTSCH